MGLGTRSQISVFACERVMNYFARANNCELGPNFFSIIK